MWVARGTARSKAHKYGKAKIPLVASRHDTTSTTCRASCDVTCCVVRAAPCLFQHGGRRRSSSARVQNDIMFYYNLLFQLTNEINSFSKTNYGDRNFIHLTNKAVYRACRARADGRVALVALVVTCCDMLCRACCTACATQHVRLFPIPKCMD